jgi:outer membrane protein assembly factor BamB
MFRAVRWLVVAPVVLFVFATMMASCGGGGGCAGSFNSSGIFVSGVCPGASPSPGYTLQTLTICEGTEPAPTPTPSAAPTATKKKPTPTPTACPVATSTSVAVGDQVGFTAQGFLTKNKKSKYQDLTNGTGTLWTTTDQSILQGPSAGQGGIYTGASTGCVCITANAGGISSLPVGIGVGSPAPVCSPCPTPSPTPTATAAPAHAAAGPTPALSSSASTNGSVFSWVYDAGSAARGPIGAGPDGHVYFITADSMLHALDSLGNEIFNRPAGGLTAAVAPDGTVFVQGTTSWIYALTNDGRPKWQIDLKSAASPLAATNATVYVSTALSASGEQLWTFSPAGGLSGDLVSAGGVVYAGSRSGSVYAISAANGSELWQIDSPAPVVAGPVVGESGAIFFGSDKLYALGSNGALIWTAAAPVSFGIAPDSVGGALDAHPDGSINLLDGLGGVVSSTRSTGPVVRTGSSASGLCYVATSDGRLYAIK